MKHQDTKWNRFLVTRDPSEIEVYALIGRMLFQLHVFEKIMRWSFHLLHATFANHENEADAETFIWRMRRKACGQLAKELRNLKAIKMEPNFDRLLARLIRRRNQLVHKLALRKEFDPKRNARWHHNVARFILRLDADLDTAWVVFATYAETLMQAADNDPRAAVLRSNLAALKVFRPIENREILGESQAAK